MLVFWFPTFMFSDLCTHRPSPGYALWHSPAKSHKTNFDITRSQRIKMPLLWDIFPSPAGSPSSHSFCHLYCKVDCDYFYIRFCSHVWRIKAGAGAVQSIWEHLDINSRTFLRTCQMKQLKIEIKIMDTSYKKKKRFQCSVWARSEVGAKWCIFVAMRVSLYPGKNSDLQHRTPQPRVSYFFFFSPFWALLDSSFERVLYVQLGRGSWLNKVFFVYSGKLTFPSSWWEHFVLWKAAEIKNTFYGGN